MPTYYGHPFITDSLLCPWEKKALTLFFSKFKPLNTDTLLMWTLSMAPSLSVLTGFDCNLFWKFVACFSILSLGPTNLNLS